ncbi:hypothetical protein B0H17DRAFT_1177604 [Mycena rosella]|uniref:Uncharacterized protein n=1 Tax=Mycena rosella TaxID=1033263 RepID=A0AAD7GNP7_MYCRO|nr:hypothetical protein B0H17DRAFT_1177604 [Mycena rosella]
MKLFSSINLRSTGESPDERSQLFSELLSSKPHIQSYIRTLILSYRPARSKSVEHILSSLPKLRSISLHPTINYPYGWHSSFSVYLRDSFHAVFATTTLRRIELRSHSFDGPQELQRILSNSLSLTELVLDEICFEHVALRSTEKHPGSPRTVLQSLGVFRMLPDVVDAVLDAFIAIDIKHLRSISCDRYQNSLLQANTYSIQEHTLIVANNPDVFHKDALYAVLPPSTSLHTLHVRMRAYKTPVINRLGNLASLRALKKLTITATKRNLMGGRPEWPAVDSRLAEVGSGLESVHLILTDYRDGDEVRYRQLMPGLDAKGILSVSLAPPGSGFGANPASHEL